MVRPGELLLKAHMCLYFQIKVVGTCQLATQNKGNHPKSGDSGRYIESDPD